MKSKAYISLFIIFAMIIQLAGGLCVFAEETAGGTDIVSLNTTNDAGDHCYFDNHYCYTSINPNYGNFFANQKTNYIECYRLDYTNPRRKDYIYLEKTDPDNDCYFDINCNRLSYTRYSQRAYDYFLVQGDFKVGLMGADCQMFLFRDSTSGSSVVNYVSAYLRADGSLKLSDGTVVPDVAKVNTWFNMKAAVNLKTSLCEVYINDVKAGTMAIPAAMSRINMVRLSLYSGTGNMYADNFSVTGLEVPYENGIEVRSDVFPDNPQIAEFLQGKVAMHGYGKLMYKDGVKAPIFPEPVYDEDRQELYVAADTLNYAFGINLEEGFSGLSGSDISVTEGGVVVYKGESHTMKNGTLTVTDRLYVPVTDFAEILGKYAFTHETGMIVISDENEFIDTTDWEYITFRPDQSAITLFNDVDFLNSFLSYEQPDMSRLKEDFASVSGEYESAHPRILLNQKDFDRLKNLYSTDETYKTIANNIISKAKSYLRKEPLVYKFDDAMRMYSSGAETQNRFMYWGYAYKLTGDSRYVKRAVMELEALDKFPDFNPMHIIDTGMFCMGLACAYDWFYEAYTPEERELARRVVFEKCFKSLSDAYYGRLSQATSGNGAVKWTSNYNAVVSGGCLNAAIATIECDPEYNLDMIDNCIRSLEYCLAGIMPGGGWGESVSYWNYTMEFLSYSMASLNTSFGTDYGIGKSQGMEDTLRYAMACLGIGGMYNYHDSGQSVASKSNSYKTFMYLANTYGIDDAYGMRMYDLLNKRTSPVVEDGLFYNENITDFEDVYDKNGTEIKIDGTELFSSRDTYNRDNSQFYFATHFGATWGYHHHCDCGSFVLDMYGTRFADDLGADDYNIENELKYSSYELYRKRAEGHNVMVIAPSSHSGSFEQNLNVFAPITGYETDGTRSYVIADMDEVYAECDRMQQGYYVDKEKMSVTMRNEFTAPTGTEVYWFMHTRADIQIDGNTAYLTRDGHTVCLRFDTNAPVAEIIKMKAEPLPTSPQVPEQNPNEAYSKVAIRMTTGANNYLTVNISSLESAKDEILTQPLVAWSLNMWDEISTQDIVSLKDYEDFAYASGSEAKGVLGAAEGDSSLCAPVGAGSALLASDTFEPENRYTAVSFNIAPYRAVPMLCDSSGNNLLENISLDSEVWNSICVIYDAEKGRAVTNINGSYGQWQDTDYTGGSAVLTLRGTDISSAAYVDNYKLYTVSAVPSLGYVSVGGVELDDSYILSDGTLTAGDLTSNGTVRVYTDSTMTERLADTALLPEGAVAVFTNGDVYIYYKVTLQSAVETPAKYYQYIDDFSSGGCVRNTLETVADITGAYGSCAHFTGTEEVDSNHYLNYALSTDDTIKTVSFDVYPTDSVTKIKFATNGHNPLSRDVAMSELTPGEWNNLTLVIDPATDINTFYVNGKASGTKTCEMKGNLRMVFSTDKSILSESEIYVDNIVLIGGTKPEGIIDTDYSVTDSKISGAAGLTYGEFCRSFRTSSYKYSYKVYGRNGELYSSDIIDEGCVLYLYGGDVMLGRYSFE
ncbi:MAG: heparinase II/III family protein [Clostridia bacterium]|nr:heparinase II/III family protein [Clostridia bacterium]